MSLYHEFFLGEDFTEDQYFESLKYLMGPDYESYNLEQLEDAFLENLEGMSEEEAENFLRKAIRGALNVVQKAAPIVGGIAGTLIGGPVGGALGSNIGNTVGKYAGIGGKALDKLPQGKPNLRKAWQTVKGNVKHLPQQALSIAQQHIQNNPNSGLAQAVNSPAVQDLLTQLSQFISNPQFQGAQLQQEFGNVGVTESYGNDYSYAEMIEALNYLTEEILIELYESNDYGRDYLGFDRTGHLRTFNPELRAYKNNQLLESIY